MLAVLEDWAQGLGALCHAVFEVVGLVCDCNLEFLLLYLLGQGRTEVIGDDYYAALGLEAVLLPADDLDLLVFDVRDPLEGLVAPVEALG